MLELNQIGSISLNFELDSTSEAYVQTVFSTSICGELIDT